MDELTSAIHGGQWTLVGAIVIAVLVRLLKLSPTLADRIPARWRPVLATGLGILWGVLNGVAREHRPWTEAIISGVVAAAIAVWGHDTVIHGIAGGKEIGPQAAEQALKAGAFLLVIFGFSQLSACSPAANRMAAKMALSAADMGCVLYLAESGEEASDKIATLCRIQDALGPEIEKLVSAKRTEVGLRKTGINRGDAGAVEADGGK